MALALNNLKRVDMPLNKETKPNLYQGVISPKVNIKDKKTYIGISSMKWKIRYTNHKFSFSHEHLKHQRALSKHFWSMKNKGLTPEIHS